MPKRILCALVLMAIFLLFRLGATAQEKPPEEEEKARPDTVQNQTQEGDEKKKKKKEEKPFAEVIEDFEAIEGLFTLYRKQEDGKVFLEIQPGQFDKVFLCSITREAGDGFYFDSSSMIENFPFVFKRAGKKVLFIHKNVSFRAEKDAAIHRAIERGVSDSIVGTASIEGLPHPERGSVLVDPGDFFIQDIGLVSYLFSKRIIKDVSYGLDKQSSYFGAIRSFPENTEIEVILHFRSSNPKPVPTIPDARSFQHTYHYSLSTLPETDYRPRPADDRIGHFLTMYQDYTSVLRDSPYNRYINRWHLEKAEPKFDPSPPKKPIVFWLENTIPVEYRQAVREGILLWSSAFERLGFQDALVVHQQPDDADWDPADVRYNTVRWIVQPGGGYAVGPAHANPFTGQVYDADIRISADMLRYVFQGYEELASPLAAEASSRELAEPGADFGRGLCDYGIGAAQQAAFGWSLIAARGLGGRSEVDVEKYLHDFLVHIVAHEVGHTLGLRHNFKGSTLRPTDRLQDPKRTSAELTSSVMDYVPVNIAPRGQEQGPYFQTALGPYDYWAIEYAYRPMEADNPESERAVLEKIAAQVADPPLAFCTDEDALGGGRGIDPDCNRYDLGADPIAFHRDRIALARELWEKMEKQFEKKGNRYPKLRQVFEQGIAQYSIAAMTAVKFIGGIHHRRDHVGDPGGRLPFEPVAAARQREALEFLTKNIFGPEAFVFSPNLLNKLAPERFLDFSGTIWHTRRIDYPIHDVIRSIQTAPLDHLYDPIRLGRLLDLELRYARDELPFTMADLFEGLREAIWSELAAPASVNSFRRALQRSHLSRLIALLIDPSPGIPEDARTLARADLVVLQDRIDRALAAEGLDPYTRAHLDETRARIQAALEAGIERRAAT